jgi:hypothetical protein
MNQLANDFVILQAHWPIVLFLLGGLTSLMSTIATAMTPYPAVETWLHFLIGLFSWAEHQNVGGISLPFVPLKKPDQPTTTIATGGAIK